MATISVEEYFGNILTCTHYDFITTKYGCCVNFAVKPGKSMHFSDYLLVRNNIEVDTMNWYSLPVWQRDMNYRLTASRDCIKPLSLIYMTII